jgi:DNA-binding NtrC family response regulator
MNRSRIPPEKKRILLVDDDVDLRSATANLLRLMGAWDVWEAESASQARAMWNENRERIDVLVTDIVMPECFWARLGFKVQIRESHTEGHLHQRPIV